MTGRKGQELAGEVFIFMAVIIVGIFILILMISNQGRFQTQSETAIEHEFADLRLRSATSSTLNDHVWRSGEIRPGKYNQMLAREVFSLYFSTPEGGEIYLGERSIPLSEVESDLEAYVTHKMELYLQDRVKGVAYSFRIYGPDGDRSMVVEDYGPEPSDTHIEFPVSLTAGETATVQLWTNASETIYSTDPNQIPEVGVN